MEGSGAENAQNQVVVSNVQEALEATWTKFDNLIHTSYVRFADFEAHVNGLMRENRIGNPGTNAIRLMIREFCIAKEIPVQEWREGNVITIFKSKTEATGKARNGRELGYKNIEAQLATFDPSHLPEPRVEFFETDDEGSLKVASFATLDRLVAIHKHVYETYHCIPARLAYRSNDLIVRVERQLSDICRHSAPIYECVLIHAYGAISTTDDEQIRSILKERYEYAKDNGIDASQTLFVFKNGRKYVVTSIEKAAKALNYNLEGGAISAPVLKYETVQAAYVFDRKRLDAMGKESTNPKLKTKIASESEQMVLNVLKPFFRDMVICSGTNHRMDLYSYEYRFRVEVKFHTTGMRGMDSKFCADIRLNPNERFYLLINLAKADTAQIHESHIWIVDGYNLTHDMLLLLIETVKSYTDIKGSIYKIIREVQQDLFHKNVSKNGNDEMHRMVKYLYDRARSDAVEPFDESSSPDKTLMHKDESLHESSTSERVSTGSAEDAAVNTNNNSKVFVPTTPLDFAIEAAWKVHEQSISDSYVFYSDLVDTINEELEKMGQRSMYSNSMSRSIAAYASSKGITIKKWPIFKRKIVSKHPSYTVAMGTARNGANHGTRRILQELKELKLSTIEPAQIEFFECHPPNRSSGKLENLKNGAYLCSVHMSYTEQFHSMPTSGYASYKDPNGNVVDLGEQLNFLRCRCPEIVDFLTEHIYKQQADPEMDAQFNHVIAAINDAVEKEIKFCEYRMSVYGGSHFMNDISLFSVLFSIRYHRDDHPRSRLSEYARANKERLDEVMDANRDIIEGLSLHVQRHIDDKGDTHDTTCWKF